MRVRKPCLRARRRLFGWNVRFPFATIFSSKFHRGQVHEAHRSRIKNLQMWVVNVSPPAEFLPNALFKALSGEQLAHGAIHILTRSHIAAIDHDRLRDLTGIKQIDTQGHPKLQRCFYPLDNGTFTGPSCKLRLPDFWHQFPIGQKRDRGTYFSRQQAQKPGKHE